MNYDLRSMEAKAARSPRTPLQQVALVGLILTGAAWAVYFILNHFLGMDLPMLPEYLMVTLMVIFEGALVQRENRAISVISMACSLFMLTKLC